MRRLAAFSVALATALAMALLFVAAPRAFAGGPTSVLVVNYEGSRAAAALTGSAAYAALEKALDASTPPTGDRTPPASFMGTQIRLTWMIHDVTPWRVDAITFDGDDVWVDTAMDPQTGAGLFDAPSVRHRPRDPALLVSTLAALGVLGEQPAGSSRPAASAPASEPAAPADPGSGPRTTSDASGSPASSGIPWWATAAAATLALGLGLVLGRRTRPDASDATGSGARGTGPGDRPDDRPEDPQRVAPVGFTTDARKARR